MIEISVIDSLRRKFERLKPELDERGCRCWAASEALELGHGGIKAVARATGLGGVLGTQYSFIHHLRPRLLLFQISTQKLFRQFDESVVSKWSARAFMPFKLFYLEVLFGLTMRCTGWLIRP
jgi:hypothetical protein